MALVTLAAAAFAAEGVPRPAGGEALDQLGWLVGNWMDEAPQTVVTSNHRWAPGRSAIVGEYRVHEAGRVVLTGTQRIAWDPLLKKVHSWVFDSQGGTAQGIWTRDGDSWLVTTWGTSGEGKRHSATLTVTREGDARALWQIADRVEGNEVAAQPEEIHLVRTPPPPTP